METNTEKNIVDLTQYLKVNNDLNVNKNVNEKIRHQSNPIYKKHLIISVKNNIHKFSVADLFD